MSGRSPAAVSREVVQALQTLHDAKVIAIALRDAKSGEPGWSTEEIDLLQDLLVVLGVEKP